MQINLTILSTGLFLLLLAAFFLKKELLNSVYNWLIFSKSAPFVMMGVGGVLFLMNVLHMSTADFGAHKFGFFIVFSAIILLSFFKMRELLAVRGLAVFMLVLSSKMLANVYCEPILYKNFFVSFVYALIIFSMVIGSLPYMFRSFFERLINLRHVALFCALLSVVYGVLLLFVSCQNIIS